MDVGVLLPPPLLLLPPPAYAVLYRLLELFLVVLLFYDCNRRKGTMRWYMRCTFVARTSCNSQLHSLPMVADLFGKYIDL